MDMFDLNSTAHRVMSMTFHFSHTVPGGLLIREWGIQSVGDLVGAVVAVFLLAILYEGLKTLREYLIYVDLKHWQDHKKSRRQFDLQDEKHSLIVSESVERKKGFKYYSISLSMHILQSILHIVQVGYGYVLMLVAMTYNVWLFLALIFGAGVGYLIFAKTRHIFGFFRERNEQLN